MAVITDVMRALVEELVLEGIPDPLRQPVSLFTLWADACRLAGEPEPPEIAALLDAPALSGLRVEVGPARWLDGGSHAD